MTEFQIELNTITIAHNHRLIQLIEQIKKACIDAAERGAPDTYISVSNDEIDILESSAIFKSQMDKLFGSHWRLDTNIGALRMSWFEKERS